MKDDVLREAARALREEADASRARRDETRARVMRSLKAQRARRLTTVRVAVPLAAVLVASAAWASAARWFPDAWHDLASQLGLRVADPPGAPPAPPMSRALPSPRRASDADAPAPPPEADAPAPPPPEADAPAPQPPEPRAAEIAPPAPLPAPPLAPTAPPLAPTAPPPRRAPVVAVAPPARAPSIAPSAAGPAKASQPPASDPQAIQRPPTGPDADALYQAAHRAHFVDRNPSAALAAWNEYLAAAPRGRFAVEAQYNRALCLVRLGRTDEARRALEPFARGAFGGYRQTESRSLLEAMSNAGP
ncbi:tetratricopeptide repeat protein [Sorangium sp. So ce854]|uniref:tetratricopeptide repeat protein n=1 Tax=Sorangium sp. So ce854 TaxID=3133322 RepID=UPI003F5FC4FE